MSSSFSPGHWSNKPAQLHLHVAGPTSSDQGNPFAPHAQRPSSTGHAHRTKSKDKLKNQEAAKGNDPQTGVDKKQAGYFAGLSAWENGPYAYPARAQAFVRGEYGSNAPSRPPVLMVVEPAESAEPAEPVDIVNLVEPAASVDPPIPSRPSPDDTSPRFSILRPRAHTQQIMDNARSIVAKMAKVRVSKPFAPA